MYFKWILEKLELLILSCSCSFRKKGNSVPYKHIFMFCLFKSCRSFASIFYKQLLSFQIVFQEFRVFRFLTIAVFKHTFVHFVKCMCFMASSATQNLPSFPAVPNCVSELNTSSDTDDKS